MLRSAFLYIFFFCTVSGCDNGNQTRNIVVYTWCYMAVTQWATAVTVDALMMWIEDGRFAHHLMNTRGNHLAAFMMWAVSNRVASEISRNEISRNVSRNFLMTFAKFRETKYMKISRNLAKVILQNCTEMNCGSFLQLNSYRIWISTQYFMIF